MAVDVISLRNSELYPSLTQNLVVTEPALIQTEIKPRNRMRRVVNSTMQRNKSSIHKPVVCGSVHLHKLTRVLSFLAAFMLLLFLCGPGPWRFYSKISHYFQKRIVGNFNAIEFFQGFMKS